MQGVRRSSIGCCITQKSNSSRCTRGECCKIVQLLFSGPLTGHRAGVTLLTCVPACRWLIDAAASADTPALDVSRLLDWPARHQVGLSALSPCPTWLQGRMIHATRSAADAALFMQELCGDVVLHHVRPGQRAREELFDLSPEWTYLNHGSYGATLRCAGWSTLV